MISSRFNLKMISVLLAVVIAAASMVACAVAPASKLPQQPAILSDKELTIRYLSAPKQVQPLRGVEVSCVATDPDNNRVTYEWSATGGEIKSKGDNEALILWVAPEKTGDYIVTVTVKNNKGDKSSKSATIAVTSETYQQLIVTSMNCYGCTNGIEASKYKNYEIRCVVPSTAPETLKYTWFASTGKISGEGPNAYWFTGAQSGNVLITVIVTDDKGNKAEGYLAINVSCCY